MKQTKRFEYVSTRPVPYNTGKVLIGCCYEPRLRSHVSPEGEFAQSLLLGYRRQNLIERRESLVSMAVLVGVFALMGMLA